MPGQQLDLTPLARTKQASNDTNFAQRKHHFLSLQNGKRVCFNALDAQSVEQPNHPRMACRHVYAGDLGSVVHKRQFPTNMWWSGVANRNVAYKCIDSFYVNTNNLLYPTQWCLPSSTTSTEEDDTTVIASNTCSSQGSYKHWALQHILSAPVFAGASFQLPTKDAIADLGVTQIFVMEGMPVLKKQPTTCPLRVSLADRRQVMSTHMCEV